MRSSVKCQHCKIPNVKCQKFKNSNVKMSVNAKYFKAYVKCKNLKRVNVKCWNFKRSIANVNCQLLVYHDHLNVISIDHVCLQKCSMKWCHHYLLGEGHLIILFTFVFHQYQIIQFYLTCFVHHFIFYIPTFLIMIHGLPWTAFVVLVICQCHVAPMLVIINGLNGSLLDKYLCTCTLMSKYIHLNIESWIFFKALPSEAILVNTLPSCVRNRSAFRSIKKTVAKQYKQNCFLSCKCSKT